MKHQGHQLVPYSVWTGSYNFTTQSAYSLENALIINDIDIASAYACEAQMIYLLGEPLDWTSEWINPILKSNFREPMKKYIYNLDNLMERTGATSFSDLEELGYDVREYLSRRRTELENEISMLSRLEKEFMEPKFEQDLESELEPEPDPELELESKESRSSNFRDSTIPLYGIWSPYSGENYIGT